MSATLSIFQQSLEKAMHQEELFTVIYLIGQKNLYILLNL